VTLFRLVIDHAGPEPVHVFLPDRRSGGHPPAEVVRLKRLDAPAPRPVLGRDARVGRAYREFRSEVELLLAGFEPAGAYRVCDSWDDYREPWSPPAPDQPTTPMDPG
jgi:hypothetical protein